MRTTLSRLVGAVGIATVLALTGAATANADSGTMTKRQARELYTKQLCRLDASVDHLNDIVFRGQKTVRAVEITPAWMSQINKALDKTAERFHDVGGKVLFPDDAWPGLVITEANESAAYMDLVAYAMVSTENDEPRKFVRLWNEALQPVSKKASKRVKEVRYLLNIPDYFPCSGATGAMTTLSRIG